MAAISIVVPVYNVVKYLNRCLESLLSQTLDNFEIILVDDGSTDGSQILCDAAAQKDSRIRVIHKENGGLSSARNVGLRESRGTFVGFVDSDDSVDPDGYKLMLQAIETYDTDFVMGDYTRILSDGRSWLKTLDLRKGLYKRAEIEKDIFPRLIMGEDLNYGPLLSVWHCLYRRSFLETFSLTFDEQVRWSEDNIFSAVMGYRCRSFYYLKGISVYHYYQNPGTITTSYRKGAWDVYCRMNEHLHTAFDNTPDYDFSRQLRLHLLYYACNCLGMELNLPKEEALQGIRRILNDDRLIDVFQGLSPLPSVSWKLKAQLLLMKYRWAEAYYFVRKH